MGQAVALGAFLLTSVLVAPISAQVRQPVESTEASLEGTTPSSTPSAASLERIRRALAVEQPIDLHIDNDVLRNNERFSNRRRTVQLFGGLDFVAGPALLGSGAPTIGAPTHQDMMRMMTPRWFTEGRPSGDLLGVATGSAFALLPVAVKALGGWLFGSDGDEGPEHPILTESEEALVRAHAGADSHVLDADVLQRGRTVVLSLVVSPDTSPALARALGERFVVLAKAFSSVEPPPDGEVGIGDYDYIVRVSSPADTAIALGGKAAGETVIHW